ncbi:MAG: EAL domain-containing protein [Actinomycetota bacterium]
MTTASSIDPVPGGAARAVLRLIADRVGAQIAVMVGPDETVVWVDDSDARARASCGAVAEATGRWAVSRTADHSGVGDVDGWKVLTVALTSGSGQPMGRRTGIAFARAGDAPWLAQERSSAQLAASVYGLTSRSLLAAPEVFESQLRGAADAGALRLHYQGEIDLDTGALVAVEALVRWQHPTLGLLQPEHFIHLAEHSTLIERLSAWVLDEACAQLATWRTEYPSLALVLRVNVSPLQLVTDSFVDAVTDVVERHGLRAGQLCLEITERVLPPDTGSLASALRRLRAQGIAIAIDDFGTGYSSLAHLKALPVDAVKIDRSFTSGLGTDAGDTAIVEAVAKLAATFGLQLIAEGIETADEAVRLVRIGCHRGQGHLFGEPRAAADLVDLLAAGGVADQLPFARSPSSARPAGSRTVG